MTTPTRFCYRHGCEDRATIVLRWHRYMEMTSDLACGRHAQMSVGPWVTILPYVQ
jgi:hypothetical protein